MDQNKEKPSVSNATRDDSITIVTEDAATSGSEENIFPALPQMATRANKVAVSTFARSLGHVVEQLQRALEEMPKGEASFQPEEVSFQLQVDAQGEVALVGKIGAGVHTSLAITLKRRNG